MQQNRVSIEVGRSPYEPRNRRVPGASLGQVGLIFGSYLTLGAVVQWESAGIIDLDTSTYYPVTSVDVRLTVRLKENIQMGTFSVLVEVGNLNNGGPVSDWVV